MKSKRLILSSVGIVVLALMVILLYSFNISNTISPYPSQFPNTSLGLSSVQSLKLSIHLNTTDLVNGQSISVTVKEYNVLATSITVSASNNWTIRGLSVGPCGTLNYPFGFGIAKGYFTSSNITSAKVLDLYNPGAFNCPMILSKINSFLFQPNGDNATVYGSCNPNPCLTEAATASQSFSGYWETTPFGTTFNNFQPGVYTVIAGDEWGTTVILHFVVTS
ncbi:MAG: hypothetical protein JRN68_07660 [Nitrososphaerota archaeon]|jgi:hypothetical protein|nr:hypothetical protein [Nitrososphaerota archaeon]